MSDWSGAGLGKVGTGAGESPAGIEAAYSDLKALAGRLLRRGDPGQMLTATSLVHEAYLRMAKHVDRLWNRNELIALAARAMRSVLVDQARRQSAEKRGGGRAVVSFDSALVVARQPTLLLELEDALRRLAAFDERKSQVVELRFFGGLSIEETAEAMGLSPATIKREWTLARAWLHAELKPGEP